MHAHIEVVRLKGLPQSAAVRRRVNKVALHWVRARRKNKAPCEGHATQARSEHDATIKDITVQINVTFLGIL